MHHAVSTLLLIASFATAVHTDYTLRLRARTETPAPSTQSLDAIAAGGEERHVFAQFHDRLLTSDRAELEARGVRVLRYVPDGTWIVSLAPGAASDGAVRDVLRWVGVIQPTDKMPRRLAEDRPGAWAIDGPFVRLAVRLHDDVPAAAAASHVVELGGEVGAPLPVFPGFHARVPRGEVGTLAAHDDVLWMEEIPAPRVVENDGSRAATGVSVLSFPPFALTGEGVHVGIWDDGRADQTHGDFAGRITLGQSAGLSAHATHVTGTLGGSGALSEANGGAPFQWRGIAPESLLYSWDMFGDVIQETADGIATHDLRIVNNSWGELVNMSNCERFGDYDLLTSQYDALFPSGPNDDLVIVFSAGNERDDGDCPLAAGGYGCLNPPKAAKNILAVGAVNSDDDTMTGFSSFGPVDDGRLKPDVVAPGCEAGGEGYIHSTLPGDAHGGPGWCGTSMAAPVVSGGAALLWQKLGEAGPPVPSAAMVKALLVATAVDLGNPGPDYAFGHGRVALLAAVRALEDDSPRRILVSDGGSSAFDFVVPSGKPSLRVALAWTDPDGLPLAEPALVNDVDLTLEDPTGAIVHPWVLDPDEPGVPATRGVDSRNNVEHVTVDDPMAGTWTLVVTGTSIPEGPQHVAVVGLDFAPPAPVDSLIATALGDTAVALSWQASASADAPGALIVRMPADGTSWPGPTDGASFAVGQLLAPETIVVAVDTLESGSPPILDENVPPGSVRYRAYAFDDFHLYAPPADTTVTVGGPPVGVDPATNPEGNTLFRVDVVGPQPAGGPLRVRVHLPEPRTLSVRVFASSGRLVRVLTAAAHPAGTRVLTWDGRDTGGARVAPGAYFVDVRAGADRSSQRVLWLR